MNRKLLCAITACAIFATANIVSAQSLPSVTSGTLKLHLDAGQGVTTTGGSVSQWDDQSGGGNHFVQGSAGLQPVHVNTVINGQPAIRFTSDRLDAVGGHTLNSNSALPFTLFAVTVNTDDPFAAFDSAPGQPNVIRYAHFGGANPNNPNKAIEIWNGAPFISFETDTAGSVISTQGFINSANANALGRTLDNRTFDNTNGLIAKGAANVSTTQGVFLNPDIGSINGGGNGFFSGDIAELIYFQGQLSVPDQFAVESYLRTKYGLDAPLFGSTQQLPNPTILANSTPFNANFSVENAIDGNLTTEYASQGHPGGFHRSSHGRRSSWIGG